MAVPIKLDLKHWVRIVPVGGRSHTITCRSFACWYANTSAPPELSTEGTEVAVAGTVTLEGAGKWFIAKTASATEIQKPSLLEVTALNEPPLTEIAVPGAFKTGTSAFETEGEAKAVRDKLTAVVEAGKKLGFWS
jgi:hypothetical protein